MKKNGAQRCAAPLLSMRRHGARFIVVLFVSNSNTFLEVHVLVRERVVAAARAEDVQDGHRHCDCEEEPG